MSKSESFSRQVNAWGFKRITQGPDINSYYHELFLKGMPHLVKWMKRSPSASSGSTRRLRASPDDEPNFYEISRQFPIPDYYNENNGRPISVCIPLSTMGVVPPSSVPSTASIKNYPALPASTSSQAVRAPEQKQSPPRHNRLRRTGGYFTQNGNSNVDVPQHQQHTDMSVLSKGHPFTSSHTIAHQYAARANATAACISEKQKLLEQMCTASVATIERPNPKRIKLEAPVKRRSSLIESNDNNNGNFSAIALHNHAAMFNAAAGHFPNYQMYPAACNNNDGYLRCISNTDESMNHEEVPSRQEWGSFCDALSSFLEEDMSGNSCDGIRNGKLKRDDTDDDDEYSNNNDDDDDDSFFRMITESIDPASLDDDKDHDK